jgi:hypothetical protein
MRDTLFLLKHDFIDGAGKPFFCPECALINGVLHYYPQLRHQLEVRYVDFPRPRPEVVALVGLANQSCPVLVLGDTPPPAPDGVEVRVYNGRSFVAGAEAIGNYLSAIYGIGRPH